MGSIAIEWKEIASVESNYNYELRLNSGDRFFGTLQPGTRPGSIAFSDVFGERNFDGLEVVELRPVEEDFADRLDLYLSANYAFTKASGVTQTEFHADVSYEDESTLNSLTSRITVSDTNEETTASSRVNASRKAWTDRANLYRLGFVGFESNDELSLDARYTLGFGMGRYLIDTNNKNLSGSVSVQALEERSAQGDQQQSAEAVFTLGYGLWRFDSPELDLRLDTSLYPSLTEGGRVRADGNARLRWEIVNDLFWDFSAWGSYDNSTVEKAGGEFDWGVTTGVGWKY